MALRTLLSLAISSVALTNISALAQEPERSQITLGNGAENAIIVDGLTRSDAEATISEVMVNGDTVLTRRANTTVLTFPSVTIAQNGWLVLHPIAGGAPNGDVVSGFAYVSAGETADVTVSTNYPVSSGDQFIAMLHNDVDEDKVFDFVFTDGVNVEDKAVFEGTTMIAHMITVP